MNTNLNLNLNLKRKEITYPDVMCDLDLLGEREERRGAKRLGLGLDWEAIRGERPITRRGTSEEERSEARSFGFGARSFGFGRNASRTHAHKMNVTPEKEAEAREMNLTVGSNLASGDSCQSPQNCRVEADECTQLLHPSDKTMEQRH